MSRFQLILDEDPGWLESDLSRRQTLGICSLVCRSWLPRSRYHPFGEVSLIFRLDHMLQSGRSSCHNAADFIRLLEGLELTTLPYVRHLTVKIQNDIEEEPAFMLVNHLLPRLAVLRDIESLTIDGVEFHRMAEEGAIKMFLGGFPQLRKLYLEGCSFVTSYQFLEALQASFSLEEITLYHVSIIQFTSNGPPSPFLAPLTPLKSISVHGINADILSFLVSEHGTRTLALHLITLDLSRKVAGCLRILGPSLQSLSIGLLNLATGPIVSQGASLGTDTS